jgi:hypothetical protein
MVTTLQKIGISLVVTVVAVFIVHLLASRGRSVVKDTPMMREISAMHEIDIKLRYYADGHQTLPGGPNTGKSIDSLVGLGILSPDDAVYIREHHVEFHGFDPSRIGPDIAVMETVFTDTRTPRRIVAYSDGSVVTYYVHTTP